MRNKHILLLAGLCGLSGCSIMPYQSTFSCEGTEDLGKCIPVQKAYEEAVTGVSAGPKMKRAGEKDSPTNEVAASADDTARNNMPSYNAYRSALYNKLGNMLEQPVTPMVRNAHVVRTLILPYTAKSIGKPLYMPRYVYFFADEPTWVLGEYLNDQPSSFASSMLQPIAPASVTLPSEQSGAATAKTSTRVGGK